MPIIQIEMFEGRTVEQKRNMITKVTEAMVETVNCTNESVKIIIRELKKENLAEGGVLYLDKS